MLLLLDLLQVLSVLTMERPVSFSAEDIRDEKVTSGHPTISGVPLEIRIEPDEIRSKFFVLSPQLRGQIPYWDNTSQRTGSRDTWMMILSLVIRFARRSLRQLCGSTTHGGKAFPLFSRPVKVSK